MEYPDFPTWFDPYNKPEKPSFLWKPFEVTTYTITDESLRLGDLVAKYGEDATLDMYNVGYSFDAEYVLEVVVQREKTKGEYADELVSHGEAMEAWAAMQDAWDGWYATWCELQAHVRRQVLAHQATLPQRPL